jgi:hypothetical protein
MKIGIGLMAAALVASGVGSARAADLGMPAAMPPAPAPELRGVVEVGVMGEYLSQTDDNFSGWAPGAYISGAISGGMNGFVWGIDGYADRNTFKSDSPPDGVTSDEAPLYVGVVGGHLGIGTLDRSIGVFGSVGATPGELDEANTGYTAGIEGITDLGGTASIFGQVGYGNITTDTNGEGFHGWFGRAGAVVKLSDDFAVMADASFGYAPQDFEDIGSTQWGTFGAVGVKGAYRLPGMLGAFLTAGYEASGYTANTEDNGSAQTVKLGISIPLGGGTAADVLNPLATSVQPYRAASWAQTLD